MTLQSKMQLEYCERQLCCNNYSNSEKICSTMQFVLKKVTCGFFLWRKLLESTVEGENWASHSEENDLEFEFWDLKNEKSTQSVVHHHHRHSHRHRHHHHHHHHPHHHHKGQRNGFHSALLLLTWYQPNTSTQTSFSAILRHLSYGLSLLLFFWWKPI